MEARDSFIFPKSRDRRGKGGTGPWRKRRRRESKEEVKRMENIYVK